MKRRQIPEMRLVALNPHAGESREFRLLQRQATIGSGEGNHFVVRRPSVSRRHALLDFSMRRLELSDVGSTNGTFVNGRRIGNPVIVEAGDEIRLGDAAFVLANPVGARAFSYPRKHKKVLSLRGAVEVALLAVALGFGAAQYLTYSLYHAHNSLILAEAVPVRQSSEASLQATNVQRGHIPRTSPATEATSAPAAAVKPGSPRAKSPTSPSETTVIAPKIRSKVVRTAGLPGKELAGGVALARLFAGSGSEAGRHAANFVLPRLNGTDASLAMMRGKVVLLNFWATWCGACRSEMPSLEKLYRQLRSYSDFTMITVSIDRAGKPAVTKFMMNYGYNFPVLLDASNATSAAYGIRGIPSTFVIGRNGLIIWNVVGGLDWTNPLVVTALKKLL